MTKIILMLGHQSKVGKDTLADILVENSGFHKIAFADKLKQICSDLFFIPCNEFYDEKLKNEVVPRYSMTRRQILQKVGQAMFAVDKYVWVNHAISRFGETSRLVITDFRFPHEIEKIKEFANHPPIKSNEYRVVPIKLHREGISDFSGSNDPSELSLVDYPWEFHIHNNGSVNDLHRTAQNIISDCLNKT